MIINYMNKQAADFLKQHIDDVKDNNFAKLYQILAEDYQREYRISDVSEILLNAGINPLDFMTEVPNKFLLSSDNVKSIDIPSNIKVINKYAFAGSKITNIKIPEGVYYMGKSAFERSEIEVIELPFSLNYFEDDVFENCQYLHTIKYNGSIEHFRELMAIETISGNINDIKVICQDGQFTVDKK